MAENCADLCIACLQIRRWWRRQSPVGRRAAKILRICVWCRWSDSSTSSSRYVFCSRNCKPRATASLPLHLATPPPSACAWERENAGWLLPFAAECLFAKCIIRLVVVGCRKQASKRPVRMCSLQRATRTCALISGLLTNNWSESMRCATLVLLNAPQFSTHCPRKHREK